MDDISNAAEPSLDLVKCTRQPGELRISKGACVRLYKSARKKSQRNGTGPFRNSKWWTIEICRTCPQGRLYAQSAPSEKKAG